MRKKFDQSLDKLHIDFHLMGGLVVEQIQKTLEAFINHDIDLAQEVRKGDRRINEMEISIEQKCVNLIALQSPVTSDLKRIIAIMKASSDLERMGDNSKSIAKATIRLDNRDRDYEIENLLYEMGTSVIEAVRKTLNAFSTEDFETAHQIIKEDSIINQQRDTVIALTIESMTANSKLIASGTEYVQLASFLERLGDYATNVAEWIIYLEQ